MGKIEEGAKLAGSYGIEALKKMEKKTPTKIEQKAITKKNLNVLLANVDTADKKTKDLKEAVVDKLKNGFPEKAKRIKEKIGKENQKLYTNLSATQKRIEDMEKKIKDPKTKPGEGAALGLKMIENRKSLKDINNTISKNTDKYLDARDWEGAATHQSNKIKVTDSPEKILSTLKIAKNYQKDEFALARKAAAHKLHTNNDPKFEVSTKDNKKVEVKFNTDNGKMIDQNGNEIDPKSDVGKIAQEQLNIRLGMGKQLYDSTKNLWIKNYEFVGPIHPDDRQRFQKLILNSRDPFLTSAERQANLEEYTRLYEKFSSSVAQGKPAHDFVYPEDMNDMGIETPSALRQYEQKYGELTPKNIEDYGKEEKIAEATRKSLKDYEKSELTQADIKDFGKPEEKKKEQPKPKIKLPQGPFTEV